MSALTDIVVIAIVIGVAHELFKSGKIDQVFQQLQAAIPTPTATPAPESTPAPAQEEYAEPAPAADSGGGTGTESTPAATGGGDAAAGALGCGFTVRPMDSDPNRWRTDDAQGKEVSGGKVYLGSKEEQEKWSREECAKRGGGGTEAAQPAADSGGDSGGSGGGEESGGDSGGGDKESNYARSCLDYTPMNWT